MISIPDIPDNSTVLAAALLYAEAGLYVGPLRPGRKDPASSLGKGWPGKTSRDPEQLREWFDGTDANVFIHVGRSGLVVVDVDKPQLTPDILRNNLGDGPRQQTRPDQPERLHWVFTAPEGQRFSNGLGSIPPGWGDIRGHNGLIVVTPSVHPAGGQYRWVTTGPVPELPGPIAAALATPGGRARKDGSDDVADAVSDREVEAFLAEHTEATRPGALDGRVKGLREYLAECTAGGGNGRHTGSVPFVTGALEEAAAGICSAADVYGAMLPIFLDAVTSDGSRSGTRAVSEFEGIFAWAVGQALEADPDIVRARVEQAMPNNGKLFDDIVANARREQSTEPEDTPKAGPRVWRADELSGSAPLEWLGVKHIPESAVTLLTGDEGIGKSLLWVHIVAAVTTGKALPELGIPGREPRHALVIVTEDDWASTVRPRLELAGADMDYVSVLCSEPDGSGSPVFPRDIEIVLSTVPRPYLIVLDAWADTVEGHLSVKDGQQARIALHPWKEAATKLRAAVVLLTHTNRDSGTSIRARYALTSELRKKARMALFAQRDESGNLVVGPDKSNLVGRVPAAVFSIEAVEVFAPTDSSDGTVPKLVFVQTADYTAADLLAESAAPPPREGAEGFAAITLATILADGKEHDRAEVIEKLATAGVPESTGKRAADKLGVVKKRTGFAGGSTWRLPFGPPIEPSVSDELNELNEPNEPIVPVGRSRIVEPGQPTDSSFSPSSSFSSAQTDGPNAELIDETRTVEKSHNGHPLCSGGCGLPIGPVDIAKGRTHHGFCA